MVAPQSQRTLWVLNSFDVVSSCCALCVAQRRFIPYTCYHQGVAEICTSFTFTQLCRNICTMAERSGPLPNGWDHCGEHNEYSSRHMLSLRCGGHFACCSRSVTDILHNGRAVRTASILEGPRCGEQTIVCVVEALADSNINPRRTVCNRSELQLERHLDDGEPGNNYRSEPTNAARRLAPLNCLLASK